MKKLITATLLMIASLGIFGQMVWVSEEIYQYDRPIQFFSTKAGHYMIHNSRGIIIVDSDGVEVLELATSGIFPEDGTHAAFGVLELPDSTFAVGTYSQGVDTVSGNGWAYSSIIKFDQNGNGTLLAKDFYHAYYGMLKASLSDGSYVVLYDDAEIVLKDTSGEVAQEISLPGVFDLLATPEDSLIVATEQGLAVMDRFGNVASTYSDFVFKNIKFDGLGRIVGVADSTITLLAPGYQLLAQVVLIGDEVKDYTAVSDTVAILTTSNMVMLYSGELSFINEFPIIGNETYRYIALNKGWITLAGEEVYGDVLSNQYSTTSFIKEYSIEGTSAIFTEDIGITGIDLGSSVVIEPTGLFPDHYWVYFPGAKITVYNYGPTPVDRFYLRNIPTGPAFNELTILPGEEVTVPWPGLRKLATDGYPSGTTVEVCAWTSQPNLTFDADAGNDLFCTDFLVSSEEAHKEPQIKLYPNPAYTLLNVQLPVRPQARNAQLRILDTVGRAVKVVQTREGTSFTLPVHDWSAGVYFLQFMEDGAVKSVEQFIIVR
jgi:type IX secretion system substrate protein